MGSLFAEEALPFVVVIVAIMHGLEGGVVVGVDLLLLRVVEDLAGVHLAHVLQLASPPLTQPIEHISIPIRFIFGSGRRLNT